MRNFPIDFDKKGIGFQLMGGSGSGSWYRFDKKAAVEDCRSIDVRRWKREGYLEPGNWFSWAWYMDDESVASIGVRTLDNGVELSYTRGPEGNREDVRYTVSLTWTECNFGGRRPWFVCPGVVNGHYCGRRVAKLYMGGRYFLCRHCYDLPYRSQQESHPFRALNKVQKIRMRLGGTANISEPFPERPKGMHHSTYRRLRWEYEEAEREYALALSAWIGKLSG